jgi:hypothetical protein
MLIAIIGNKGSGKSLTAVKLIVDKKIFAYTNFNLKGIKEFKRLKYDDIIISKVVENAIGKRVIKREVNWHFWRTVRDIHPNFSVFIDEIHNLIHSRRSMSSTNILMSIWVSQIRKILSDNEDNHLYVISQEARKIDVDFRDLLDLIIYCRRINIKGHHYVRLDFYNDIDCYMNGMKSKESIVFNAEKYYKYYNTKEFINFGDSEEYI